MNEETLKSFIAYCEANPEQRFWQALRNWANEKPYLEDKTINYILWELTDGEQLDTWELN